MEFSYSHHHQHHHHHHHHHYHHRHSTDDDKDRQPPPRPQDYYPPPQQPPPPPLYGGAPDQYPPPPPPFYGGGRPYHYPSPNYYSEQESYYPPPPTGYMQHESHVTGVSETHHSYRPHLPEFLHHHTEHEAGYGSVGHAATAVGGGSVIGLGDLVKKPTMKVYCKAEPNYCLTIRRSTVILARSDRNDPYQHWYKDEKFSTRVKDEEGCPCFSLVNKATGEAMKHSVGASHPVQLIPYSSEKLDESILWTESRDLADGYRAVRMVNNIHLNLDAFRGDKESGGVHDGTAIGLWQWNKGDNQRWKIAPYCKFVLMTSTNVVQHLHCVL